MLWCWKSSQASVIITKIYEGKNWETQMIRLKIPTQQRLICYWPTDWPKCHFLQAQLAVKNKNNPKNRDSRRVKWGIQMPLRTQQWIQRDEPQRQKRSITVQSDILQTAAQCHLEVPQATVETEQNWRQTAQSWFSCRCHPHFCRCAFRVSDGERWYLSRTHAHAQILSRWKEGNMSLWLLILYSPHN